MGILRAFSHCYRPINVQWRWNSSTMMPEEYPSKQRVPYFPCNAEAFEIQYQDNEYKANFKSPHLGFSRRVPSPESISVYSNSYRGLNSFVDDWELNSPISVASSLCQEPEANCSVHDHALPEQIVEQDDDDDEEEEIMSSYVIEVNSSLRREDCEPSCIDEAIAWAKEKFQSGSCDEESSMRIVGSEQTIF
ncbi:uncharacterized protein LOC130713330 [Lotus japonicus]|uniref:uncharacterized protein LOC130713330 n=1 Tax=Lotus japonicus TaxID=34305 RepID=UPI0025896837|nr:uncharacterized protein LOC130713330 [Lotus japonicus]